MMSGQTIQVRRISILMKMSIDLRNTFKKPLLIKWFFYFLNVNLKNNIINDSTRIIALAIIMGKTPFTRE